MIMRLHLQSHQVSSATTGVLLVEYNHINLHLQNQDNSPQTGAACYEEVISPGKNSGENTFTVNSNPSYSVFVSK